jgi:predicted ATPase
MNITRIEAANYKSFDLLDVELRPLNLLVGANASGKSNVLSAIRLLKNTAAHGLDNALSIAGGVEYVRNTAISAGANMRIAVSYGHPIRQVENISRSLTIGVRSLKATYEFSLAFPTAGRAYKIASDKLSLAFEIMRLERNEERKLHEKEHIGDVQVTAEIRSGKVHVHREPSTPDLRKAFNHLAPFEKASIPFPKRSLLIESPYFHILNYFTNPFDEIGMYDFDPRLSKKAASITGRTDLDEDGANLSIVLRRIIESPRQKRKFMNLLSDLLPFVSDLHVMKFADRSYLFTVRERFQQKVPRLPGTFVSDGTIHIAAIIAALYFTPKDVIIIEEPERNLHPQLISRLLQMFTEVSAKKQLLLTTHNPEVVRHAEHADLMLVSRSQEGFSRLSRPSDMEQLKSFLTADMGMEELFVQNFLGLASNA